MKKISSLDNSIVKNIVKLKKPKERDQQGLLVVDGHREIKLAIQNNWEIINLFYCPSLDKGKVNNAKQFFALEQVKIIEASEAVFKKICYKSKPDGFLALIKSKTLSLADIRLSPNPVVLVLENVEKPGNLGAIIRTAVAGGVNVVIINNSQTDTYNPNIIRASEGYIFSEILVKASFMETINWLKDNKIKIFGASTSKALEYTKANLSGPIAVVVGSEAQGLSLKWLEAVDQLIKIPMLASLDSLNVSVATAIILFEALRQRAG